MTSKPDPDLVRAADGNGSTTPHPVQVPKYDLSGCGYPDPDSTGTRASRALGHPGVKGAGNRAAAAGVQERLRNPAAFLSRSDLRELGLERRAIDAIFRALPVIALPGYSRPLVKVSDYLALVEASTYRDDRVRP